MTVTAAMSMKPSLTRWGFASLLFALIVGLGPTPILAQNGGGDSEGASSEQLEQLKKAYKAGLQAAKANNHSQAYTQLEQALQLARDAEQEGASNQILGYLQKLPKNWGNAAIENEQYEQALTHFEKGVRHAENDAYMHYGQGLSLVNLDSTETGLETLQQAIEVGNKTGNTRVTGLATERIRDEFLARASESLNAENPTNAEANAALDALDEMTEYVDPNAQSYFYRARALFELDNYEEAIAAAQEGLSLHQGSRSDAAKYHFIVAESQMNLGNEETACQTFGNAAYGDYQARAQHYLENQCE